MATVRAYKAMDMSNPTSWTGDQLIATKNEYTIRNNEDVRKYSGEFTYKAGVLTGGKLTQYSQYDYGDIYDKYVISAFVLDLKTAYSYIKTGQVEKLYELALAGDDKFYASTEQDYLKGYGGNDTFYGGVDQGIYDGGSGIDTVDQSMVSAGAMVDMSAGNRADEIYVLTETGWGWYRNFEIIKTGSGNDMIYGYQGNVSLVNNQIFTGAGNDYVQATLGLDFLNGGLGTDTVDYSWLGKKVVVTLNGSKEVQVFIDGNPKDKISGFENVIGGEKDDILTGDAGANKIVGGLGNDIVKGSGGGDLLMGYDESEYPADDIGVDTLDYSNFKVSIRANFYNDDFLYDDYFYTSRVFVGDEIDYVTCFENLIGGQSHDSLAGNAKVNRFIGGLGDDSFRGGEGNDYFDGGVGSDWATYDDKTSSVYVELKKSAEVYVKINGVNEDIIKNVESIQGGSGDDTLIGDDYNNAFSGGDGDDAIYGGAGNDSIHGGDGNNFIDAGSGDDWISFGSGNSTVNGGLGVDSVSFYYLTQVAIQLGGASPSVITGGGNTHILMNIENVYAGHEDDTLIGSAGVNVLFGDGGDDVLIGAGGIDKLDGGDGTDTADFSDASLNGEKVNVLLKGALEAKVTVNGKAAGTLKNIENIKGTAGVDSITGDSLNNNITGESGNDILKGGGGTDTLVGGADNDSLQGDVGTDTLDGGDGIDTADYSDKTKAVEVTLNGSTDAVLKVDGLNEDTIKNIENLIGGSGNDLLTGDSAANALSGGVGNDTLKGGAGADQLTGGKGADRFVFNDLISKDKITEFKTAEKDKIVIDVREFINLGFGFGSANLLTNKTGLAADSNDYLIFNTSNKTLYYDADGNGNQHAVAVVELTGVTKLLVTDFDFIIA